MKEFTYNSESVALQYFTPICKCIPCVSIYYWNDGLYGVHVF